MPISAARSAVTPSDRISTAQGGELTVTRSTRQVSREVPGIEANSLFAREVTLEFEYQDPNRFFGGRPEVDVYLRGDRSRLFRNNRRQDEGTFEAPNIALQSNGNGVYTGSLTVSLDGGIGDNVLRVVNPQVALHASGNVWDSRYGSNYSLRDIDGG